MAIKKAQNGNSSRGKVSVGGNVRLDDGPKVKKSPVKKSPVKIKVKKVDKSLEGPQDAFIYSKGMPTAPLTRGGAKNGKTMKKAKNGSAFAKLAPPYNKATFADKIAGATKNKAKSGTSMKKCKYGCN